MSHGDFPYGSARNADVLPLSLSIFADDEADRALLGRDADAAGFQPAPGGTVASLLEGPVSLGDCVLLYCDEVSESHCAALLVLDIELAAARRPAVVAVTLEALDDVFGCLDQSRPQILVAPNRAQRLVALASLMARGPMNRLHETDEDDRQTLVRLSEQVALIAERIEQLGQAGLTATPSPFRFEPTDAGLRSEAGDERKLIRPPRPPLPDPRLVRRIIRQRQLRAQVFGSDLFADPAWDILLDLTAARAEHTRVSVTSLCIASGVPPTTALRWISQMVEAGLLERVEDESDRRRAFIQLSDKAAEGMARYFAELGKDARSVV